MLTSNQLGPSGLLLGRRLGPGVLAWTLLVIAAVFAGYQQQFSTYAAYDDEGYVMISLQSFLDGNSLYDRTYTQYGPAYYFLQRELHRGLALPVTHEVTRLKSLAFWLAAAALSAFFVFRVTGTQILAMAAFAAVFLHLDKLPLETGHPQELCVLGIASLLAVSTIRLPSTVHGAGMLAAGVLVGVVTMTKINVGVLLALATLSGLLAVTRRTIVRCVLVASAATASLLLPLVLFGRHLFEFGANLLPAVTVLSLASLWIAVSRIPQVPTGTLSLGRTLGWFCGGMGLTLGMFAIATVWNGTPAASLYAGIVGQHAGFAGSFFHPPPVTLLAVPAALGMLFLVATRRSLAPGGRLAALGILVSCGVAYLLQSGTPPTHGLQERGSVGLLLSFAPPLMCLLLIPSGQLQPASNLTPRVVLAFVAILQTLVVFPTPGTQTAVGTFPLLLGCLILGHDWSRNSQVCTSSKPSRFHSARPATVAVLSLFVMALVVRDVGFWRYRSALTPLDLPGTGALRLEKETVQQQRELVAALRKHADTFVFANHGRNSLYFWTGIRPPTSWNATFWRFLLRADQQAAIVEALRRYPKACVVHESTPIELPSGPLVQFIQDEFEPVQSSATWKLLRRVEG